MGKKLDEAIEQAREKTARQKETLLGVACDLCHKPYDLTQEQLMECCESCPVLDPLNELIKLERAYAMAELIRIVKEEMLPEKKA